MIEKFETENIDHEETSGHLDAPTKADAQEAARAEHTLTLAQALKTYPKAIFWSVAVSTSIIMEGYDIVLVTSLFAQPAFTQRFGTYTSEGGWQIPGPWQSALGTAPTIGAILGALANGYLTHKYGYRRVLLVSMVFITAFIFLLFFATSLSMLLVGLILCGIPWGVFATMAPSYASEVCPLQLRGYLTVYVNLCWALGQLIAAGVLVGFSNGTEEIAYKIPFGIQWAWPIPLFAILWFAPESPWWLVSRGRMNEAQISLARLSSKSQQSRVLQTLSMMEHTQEIEREVESGTSYLDCFKGIDLRRTEIVCAVFAAQVWSGSPLGGTPVYFFVQAGLSSDNAFRFSVGGLGLASIGTIISWALLNKFGRRTLYVWGLGILAVLMLVVGIIAAAATKSSGSSYAQATLVLIWLLVYYLTVGPVCYAIISETSAVRLRSKSVCLSRISYYIAQTIGNVIEPYMVNPTEANWQGKTGFFWAGTCLIFFIWSFFRLPETRGRSYEELDILFNNKVKARDFSKLTVDAYADNIEDRIKRE